MRPRPKKLHLLRWLPRRMVTTIGPAADGALYLTFDDGPHPDYTPKVLDVLARHAVKATFFLVGTLVERHPELARRIVAEGHAVGNHSHSHPEFRQLALPAQLAEIDACDQALRKLVGAAPIPLRTPRGALPPALLWHLLHQGRPIIYWSYDTHDYRRRDSGELLRMLRAQPPAAGDILLMHDDGPASLDLIDALLPEWKARGLDPRALPAQLAFA